MTTSEGVVWGFDPAWDRFKALVHGKLLEKSRQEPLTAAGANMALALAATAWDDAYGECGSWLAQVRADDAEVGAAIAAAVRAFRFEPVPESQVPSGSLPTAAAVAGAAAGAAVATLGFQAGLPVTLLSAAAPAAVLYPVAKTYREGEADRAQAQAVDAYLEQLDLLRENIEGLMGRPA